MLSYEARKAYHAFSEYEVKYLYSDNLTEEETLQVLIEIRNSVNKAIDEFAIFAMENLKKALTNE